MAHDEYESYRAALADRILPCAYVDLEKFNANIQQVLRRAGQTPVCVATKSLRCTALLERIFQASPRFHSLMAYSCREAVFLAGKGFDQILVAYPVLREADARLDATSGLPYTSLWDALRDGKSIRLMVDAPAQVEWLERLGARENVVIPLCMDLDLSTSFPGLHFGVRRSPISTPDQALALWREIERCSHLRLDGVMGYEAQIAGVQDAPPASAAKRLLIPVLKRRSIPEVRARRAAVVQALRNAGAPIVFVNGGGTGSVESTIDEEAVTEVTVGSAFYSPTLFDHYAGFRHAPAAGFALEITRIPRPCIYTCHGGGYVASGPAGADRLPQPFLPEGGRLLPLEGAGEVQTPVAYSGSVQLSPGDPIFFRHAKAGELCERFNALALIEGGRCTADVPTYRGEGMSFL